MYVDGKHFRTIWHNEDAVEVIDQTRLPHSFETIRLSTLEDAATAIKDMWVRGAPLIGATAAYGVALALKTDTSDVRIKEAVETLSATRPTAINLKWALDRVSQALNQVSRSNRVDTAFHLAAEICDEDVEINRRIGEHGLSIIKSIEKEKRGGPINLLTHCNAGWLATVDWGTATSPMYQAFDAGIDIHVWVDETRPRSQGAYLTAWELGKHGIPHTLIVDNAGGHLMQHGQVDMVITGTDRTTARGDVCNKIGTYLKALAAWDNDVPFYVALPSPTIDWTVFDGCKEIPIEERNGDEVSFVPGKLKDDSLATVRISPETTQAGNPAFDVTPAKYVTGLITERGLVKADEQALKEFFPDLQP